MSGADGLRIGVTLHIRKGAQSLWENGIFQNCHFLLMTLQAMPGVAQTFVVNGGPGNPQDAPSLCADLIAPVIGLGAAMTDLDLVIELSAQLDPAWTKAFTQKGGRVIAMRVANDYVIDVERMAFGLEHGLLASGSPYAQVWTLPAFADTCAPYYAAVTHAPVIPMPHLWSPLILQRALAGRSDGGASWGYVPGRAQWRLAVLEPNICSVKSCHLPMLVAEEAYRRRPGGIEALRVFNAIKLKENETFVRFASALDIVRSGHASFEPRLPVYEIMGHHADAIVSHHWHNAQNYLYYEALWGGYPLIHNSHLIGDCGYRYTTFDSGDGGLALLQALASHDADIDAYRARAGALIAALDPVRPATVETYRTAIAAAFA